jgi:hypothetical protein
LRTRAAAAVYTALVANRKRPDPGLLSRVRPHSSSSRAGVRAAIEAIATAGHSPDAFHQRRIRFAARAGAVGSA